MVLRMASQRDIEGAYDKTLAQHAVLPNFSDLVPQDRQLLIDEIIRRAEQEELERIKKWMTFKAEMEAKSRPAERGLTTAVG